MKDKTALLLELWLEARTRFSNQMESLSSKDLKKKLGKSPNSLGFLVRHMGEVELLFAKNVFDEKSVKVTAKTVMEKQDNGQWTDLEDLQNYTEASFKNLKQAVEKQEDKDWESTVTTQEFGTKTKAEAFGRIVSHTAYHAGQMALISVRPYSRVSRLEASLARLSSG